MKMRQRKRMITRLDAMAHVLRRVPGFREQWQAHLDYWEGEEAGLCNDMAEFSRYVSTLIADKRTSDLGRIFSLVEELMVNGDSHVKDATATCFLENLLNVASSGRIDAASFVPLLGPESRAYAIAWDKFTGVSTPGLYSDAADQKS